MYAKMLLQWMRTMVGQGLFYLPESKQSAYNLWAYYTGRDHAGRLTQVEWLAVRQAVQNEVGDKTFAQLLAEEGKL